MQIKNMVKKTRIGQSEAKTGIFSLNVFFSIKQKSLYHQKKTILTNLSFVVSKIWVKVIDVQ